MVKVKDVLRVRDEFRVWSEKHPLTEEGGDTKPLARRLFIRDVYTSYRSMMNSVFDCLHVDTDMSELGDIDSERELPPPANLAFNLFCKLFETAKPV